MKNPRRDFLRGLGGFALATPFLTSLAPFRSVAQTAPKKRFVAFHHSSGIFERVWYPTVDPTTANGFTAFAPDVFHRQLSQVPRMADGSLTENFKKNFDPFVAKMNLYRGLDIVGGDGHSESHFLCGMRGLENQKPQFNGGSIDTLIAKSANFYSGNPAFRAIRTYEDSQSSLSVSWERNLTTGEVTKIGYQKKPIDLFNLVFGNLVVDPVIKNKLATMKLTIGDVVLTDYKAKMNDRRISSEDKNRLSNFVDNLQEVQRKLASATPAAPVTCTKPSAPFSYDYANLLTETQMMDCMIAKVDILAAAIACDLTRVCVFSDNGFISNHDYSHSDPGNRDAQMQFMKYNRRAVELVSRFVGKLDAMIDDQSTGKTVLDNSLVVWGSEISNGQSHRCESMPLVSFGSAGNSIRTGYYVDYRKRPYVHLAARTDFPAMGRSYSQFLITVMRSMGLQPAEYNNYGDGGGFGYFPSSVQYSDGFYEQYRAFRNQTLPFISLV